MILASYSFILKLHSNNCSLMFLQVQLVAVTTAQAMPTAILTTTTLDFAPVTATLPVTLDVSSIQPSATGTLNRFKNTFSYLGR